jgi:hypothetical protein
MSEETYLVLWRALSRMRNEFLGSWLDCWQFENMRHDVAAYWAEEILKLNDASEELSQLWLASREAA